jgi:hypothetical protein
MARARKKASPRVKPVTFVPVERVFKAQVKVRALRDINGWANRDRRVKWHIGAGRVGYLDEDHAREFSIKGYVEVIDGSIKPASEDEVAEFLSTTTTIGLGAPDG